MDQTLLHGGAGAAQLYDNAIKPAWTDIKDILAEKGIDLYAIIQAILEHKDPFFNLFSVFDDPRDFVSIELGFKYYDKYVSGQLDL